jgi:xylulokinase
MRLCGLSGAEAFIDRSYLHFSSFADNRSGRWDDGLLGRFDFPGEKLPRIVEPTEIVGTVTPEASAACGLREGTPVAAGCGDTVASLLSAGAVRPGIVVDVAGTASVFAATVDDFRPDLDNGTLGVGYLGIPGMWYVYAYINGGGMNPEWFVDKITEEGEPDRLRRRDEAASRIEDTHTLPLFLPHLAGRVSPGEPDLRGAFVGLNWNHGRDELYRAVLEGVALEYGLYEGILKGLFPDLSIAEVRATGGGAKSGVWNLMKSGVLGAPVAMLEHDRGAPAGAAMVAAVASGLADSLPAIGDTWVTTAARTQCPPERRDFYRERVERYGALIRALSRFCREYPFENEARD